MRFTNIKIKNFRSLVNIEVDLTPRCNVIVGPNAIGKTTFLEAIRLVKALASPRTNNEANQVMYALGISNAQNPLRFKS